ncbi:hypothetical protein DFR50_106126 [Roseiarcus fermentans]|uniref:Uncharacterized protein n=1 Tax=Roseiarcus fermentans TaxID=1473586 RepID=A0A366FN88_9HYPH|nr:hypothetical protein [Roseiarcus fermentans]RBP16164.1 hypothetical protein DFR50_106126 [Roseiarcus fermentans]
MSHLVARDDGSPTLGVDATEEDRRGSKDLFDVTLIKPVPADAIADIVARAAARMSLGPRPSPATGTLRALTPSSGLRIRDG